MTKTLLTLNPHKKCQHTILQHEMPVFYAFYLLAYLIICWGYCGYAISLYLASKVAPKRKSPPEITSYPSVTVLVPCFNEENMVEAKVSNLRALNYPKEKLEVVFLDGNSD
jgi:cellulose synthase/poly-beta-1,6-N-acetylglucosamine synthase-like glycosyltransferase